MGKHSGSDPKTPMNRRSFLALGALGAGAAVVGYNLSHSDNVDRLAERHPREVVERLPKGTLVIMGGQAELGSRIPETAEQMGIDAELLKDPDKMLMTLPTQQLEDLTDKVDFAGLFRAIGTFAPINGRRVVCVTSASEQHAQRNEWLDTVLFKLLGASEVVAIGTKDAANDDAIVEKLTNSDTSLVYFDGGNQSLLMKNFFDTKAYHAIRDRYLNDSSFTVSGSSAGAAVMSGDGKTIMDWNTDHSGPVMGSGFGFLSKVIVDTHLHRHPEYHRLERLQLAVNDHKDCIGLGIDERTGLVIRDGEGTVIGQQKIWKLEPSDTLRTFDELEHQKAVFAAGDRISLKKYAYVSDRQSSKLVSLGGR